MNYNNKKSRTVEHDSEKSRNIFIIILILLLTYVFVNVNSDKNDWTTISFFSNLLKSVGDFSFIFLIVTFIFLYTLSIYIFIQKHSENRIDFSDSDTIQKTIGIAIASSFPLFLFISFPLCLLFTVFQLIDGFRLFSIYNKIPTSKQIEGNKIIINSNTSIDEIFPEG